MKDIMGAKNLTLIMGHGRDCQAADRFCLTRDTQLKIRLSGAELAYLKGL